MYIIAPGTGEFKIGVSKNGQKGFTKKIGYNPDVVAHLKVARRQHKYKVRSVLCLTGLVMMNMLLKLMSKPIIAPYPLTQLTLEHLFLCTVVYHV